MPLRSPRRLPISAAVVLGAQRLHDVCDPVRTDSGTTIPGLRLGQARSHALLSALLTFRTHLDGFTNRDLRLLTAQLRGLDPATVTTGQTTYDLRRLRSHDLIERRPHSHRYRVTDQGLRTAMFLTRVHDRLLPTGLAQQADPHSPHRLRAAATAYQRALDTVAEQNGLAA